MDAEWRNNFSGECQVSGYYDEIGPVDTWSNGTIASWVTIGRLSVWPTPQILDHDDVRECQDLVLVASPTVAYMAGQSH